MKFAGAQRDGTPSPTTLRWRVGCKIRSEFAVMIWDEEVPYGRRI